MSIISYYYYNMEKNNLIKYQKYFEIPQIWIYYR